jgi:hypothetical protein
MGVELTSETSRTLDTGHIQHNCSSIKLEFLPVILYWYETSFLNLREEPRVSESREPRIIMDVREKKQEEAREDYIMRSFIIFAFHQINKD